MSENTETRAECPKKKILKLTAVILAAVTVAGLWVGAGALLVGVLFHPAAEVSTENVRTDLTADFENVLTKKLNGVGVIISENMSFRPPKRVYAPLNDGDMVAPKPNPACYGTADKPEELAAVLEAAEELLDGQETLFTTKTEIFEGS